MQSVIDGNVKSYEAVTPADLSNKVNLLVELTAAGKIQLATNGLAIGPIRNQFAPGEKTLPVRLLGKNGTVKLVQSAAITCGARVVLDSANPGKVKTLPVAAGTYRSLGIKDSIAENGTAAGAAGDVIEVIDVIETVIVT